MDPKLNPNVIAVLTGVLVPLAGWLYRKAKGEKQESLTESVWHVLDGIATKLAESDYAIDVVRTKLTAAAYDGLKRLGIKATPTADLAIALCVERGISAVRQRVLARKQLEAQLAAMLSKASAVMDAFDPPTNPSVPKLAESAP